MRVLRTEPTAPLGPELRGLILDVAGVLYDATLVRRQLYRRSRRYGIEQSFEDFFASWELDFLPDVCAGRREYPAALREFLASRGLAPGQIDELQAACGRDFHDLEAGQRPLPGVKATLRRLADSRVSLAVLAVSPHPSGVLAKKLESLGLGGYFVAVMTSRDFAPAAAEGRGVAVDDDFAAALEALVLSAHQVVYVSRNRHALERAGSAGIRTAALGREAGCGASWQLAQFAELLDFVHTDAPRRIAC